MAKLNKEQLEGMFTTLSGGFIQKAAVGRLRQHIRKLEEDEIICRKKIQRMEEALEVARSDEKRAVKAADRLQDNVVQLESERQKLADKLLEKKVALPREVAEAIEWFRRQCMSNEEIYELSFEPSDGKYASAINTWSDVGEGDGSLLMEALVNGYTVEEPPTVEDRMRDKLHSLMQAQGVQSPIPLDRLAEQLTLVAREVLAGQRSEQEAGL